MCGSTLTSRTKQDLWDTPVAQWPDSSSGYSFWTTAEFDLGSRRSSTSHWAVSSCSCSSPSFGTSSPTLGFPTDTIRSPTKKPMTMQAETVNTMNISKHKKPAYIYSTSPSEKCQNETNFTVNIHSTILVINVLRQYVTLYSCYLLSN